MILEDSQQAVAAVKRMLTAVRAGGVASTELRAALEQTRVFMAAGTAFQTAAAELIAARERHGDGGAEVLAVSAGLSKGEARSQVKTAQALRQVPQLRDAVQSGEVSQANARRLADAITKTGSDAVAGDAELLKQAGSMRPEQFVGAANRWIASQQGDDGASEHARQRARRYLKFYDTPEGMIALHGEFDKITGQRLRNRLRHTAARLFNADKQLPESERREFPQCLADALQHHTTETRSARNAHRRNSSHATGNVNSHTSSRTITGTANVNRRHDGGVDADDGSRIQSGVTNAGAGVETVAASAEVSGGWVADITVLARVDDTGRDLIYELSDGSRLPPAVVEELTCNARLTGLVYDRNGDALWRTRSRRTVTETQWQALLAIYGGCFHCGAEPSMCQAHHITAYSRGGATSLENLIMVCWNCHHRIHHDNWQIHKHEDGSHSLHPPSNQANAPRDGPAHNDDWPPEPASGRQTRNLARPKHKSRAKHSDQSRTKHKPRNLTQSRSNVNARDPAVSQEEGSNQARDPTTPATLW